MLLLLWEMTSLVALVVVIEVPHVIVMQLLVVIGLSEDGPAGHSHITVYRSWPNGFLTLPE